MPRRHVRTAAAIVLLAGAFAAYRWWTSPERQIEGILDDIAAALSHDEPDTSLQALSRTAGLQPHFAADAFVETPRLRIGGRQEIVAMAARVRSAAPVMRVRFFDPDIDVNGASALLAVTAEVMMGDGSGEAVVDVHRVTATLAEAEGRWVVTSARLMPAGEPDS